MSVLAPKNTALITGAASGVGFAVAQLCHKKGMNLALVDNNASYLEHAKKSLSGGQVEYYEIDVSKPEQWANLKTNVEKRFGGVHFLMLNAGIGAKEWSWEDAGYFHRILDVNLFGQIHGINTFLPTIRSQKSPTAVVMTGSKQGITNPPGNPAYNASKAAVKSIAEQLSYDLKDTTTSVHLLVPGWTFTGLSGGHPGSTKEKPAGAWSPSQVADHLEKRMNEGSFWAICPDNDVTAEMDQKRMLWTAGDAVYGRPPLSRWRDDWKEKAQSSIDAMKL